MTIRRQALAIAAAYVIGSYAYSALFSLRMSAQDPCFSPFAPVQLVLLAIAPVWFAVHMPLVLLCTVMTWGHGRGSWDDNNSASFLVFSLAFVVVYCGVLVLPNRLRRRPTQPSEPTG